MDSNNYLRNNMETKEILQKIKPFYTILLIITIASIFFALGRLSGVQSAKTGVKIEYPNTSETSLALASTPISTTSGSVKGVSTTKTVVVPSISQSSEVIGSKSGKKYYFPWCGTVKRIKPENQVHFASIDEARKAGFTPGGNCKGLQ